MTALLPVYPLLPAEHKVLKTKLNPLIYERLSETSDFLPRAPVGIQVSPAAHRCRSDVFPGAAVYGAIDEMIRVRVNPDTRGLGFLIPPRRQGGWPRGNEKVPDIAFQQASNLVQRLQ